MGINSSWCTENGVFLKAKVRGLGPLITRNIPLQRAGLAPNTGPSQANFPDPNTRAPQFNHLDA